MIIIILGLLLTIPALIVIFQDLMGGRPLHSQETVVQSLCLLAAALFLILLGTLTELVEAGRVVVT